MSARSKPLRTALIGLSASAATSWAANAHLPGLLTAEGKSRIAIKGLLNSSPEASKAAIEKFDLPNDTKAYSSPEELAQDEEIDFVICNTRVDKHFQTILPSIRAGKDVFVEWPVAHSPDHIAQIVQAAKESEARVAVGLQRRFNPIVQKVRDLVDGGKGELGKILSVEIRMFGGSVDRAILPAGLKYFTQREVGGNAIVIVVGHALDAVQSIMGAVDLATLKAKTQLQRPVARIRNMETNEIVEEVESNVPDLLSFNAGVVPNSQAVSDATLSFFFRRGQPFPGTPSLTWNINMEHGEIRMVSPTGTSLDFEPENGPVTIQMHHHKDDRVEDIKWDWSDEQKKLPLSARSVADTLFSFVDGKNPGDGWISLEDAAGRAEVINNLLNA